MLQDGLLFEHGVNMIKETKLIENYEEYKMYLHLLL